MNFEQALYSYYERTHKFMSQANQLLPAGNKMFFNGNIISGNINNPQVLFLSINPGYHEDNWDEEQQNNKILNGDFAINECKYLHENAENKKLAKQITNIVLNDNVKHYNHCAETYITSFFNTPNERVLNQQLAILKPELKAEHYNIMSDYTKYLLNNLLPNNIVCIGFNVFKRTLDALGISPSDVKFETYKTASGRDRVFYKSVRHENTLIHGVLHLSACHISSVGVDKMREIFKNTIKFD